MAMESSPTVSSPPRSEVQQEIEEEDPNSPTQNPNSMIDHQKEQEEEKLVVEEEQNPNSDPPQSSETLTLDFLDPQQNESFVNDQDPDDQDGSSAFSPRISDSHASVFSATPSRRGGPKRKKMTMKRRFAQEKSQKKLEILTNTFKPIPFAPAKSMDFSSHEKLLKRLGLWDFAHTKFDRYIHHDLLLQLVANFNHNQRCSYVNGIRIRVSRADLARALSLPVKKVTVLNEDEDDVASEESIAFIENFVSNWLLLHEDIWMMPNEVMNWTKMIREGNFERVDWAGMVWFMVEKELMQSPQLVNCYYASHLQCLIRSQREDLLNEEVAKVEEVDLREEQEQEQEQEQEREQQHEEEDEVGNNSLKLGGNYDSLVNKLEEHNIELCLGQDSGEKADVHKERASIEDMMDLIESKEEQGQCLLDGKSTATGPMILRRCTTSEIEGFYFEGEKNILGGDDQGKGDEEDEEEEEEEEEEEGEEEDEDNEFRLLPKSNSVDGFPSGQYIQEMDTDQIPFSSGLELHDPPIEFLSSRDDSRMIAGGSGCMPFGNSNKRVIDHDIDNSLQSLNGGNKRLRSDNVIDYDTCMDQLQHWLGKSRMMYAEKEQAYQQSTVNQQYLIQELQRRDDYIEHKAKFEEQKMQANVYRLERELYVMEKLLEGYKKALRETNKAFEEYRARCPESDEPLYKDVNGSGGDVLSIMELERIDKQNRVDIEKKFKDLEDKFVDVFYAHLQDVDVLGNKLLDVENEVKNLRESFAKRGDPEPFKPNPDDE